MSPHTESKSQRPVADHPRPASAIALTGTPGVGKSSVASRLTRSLTVVEVGDLAVTAGLGRRVSGTISVDLRRLQQRFAALRRRDPYDVYVGHLAHLLPIRDVIVLRCQPVELSRRLRHARRGTRSDRDDNVVSEAIDLVLREAVAPGRRVWEIDTTGRTPTEIAEEVARRISRRGPSRFGTVDWLADPQVTDYLLDRTP
jgi:adenylate kinase